MNDSNKEQLEKNGYIKNTLGNSDFFVIKNDPRIFKKVCQDNEIEGLLESKLKIIYQNNDIIIAKNFN